MVEEEPFDIGGTAIDPQDILSDDLICKIKGLNPDLGVPGKDPFYERYAAHRDEIENAELIVIDANALNRSSIMNLDLSGDTSGIDELASDYFQLREDTLEPAFGDEFDYFDCEEGNSDEGFGEFSAWGETEYSEYSDGAYA